MRQLNAILKKFVRRPTGATQLMVETPEGGKAPILAADPELAERFVRDAVKAVEALEAVLAAWEKDGTYGDEDRETYTISVHSMKTALSIAGEAELSAVAGRLEEAARDGNTDVMSSESRSFLCGLRAVIDKFTSPKQDGG
jgi:HPt (histidine-containing phosphotransfer) domain-containing protein